MRGSVCLFLFYTRLYRVPRWLRDAFRKRRGLIILVYHKVNDDYEKGKHLRPHVRGTPVADFRRQMRYLKKRHNVIPLQTAVSIIREGAKLPKNAVAITFDDGYRDNYTNAYPVLRLHCLPATFFLTTGFIGCRRPAWQVTLSAYLRLSSQDTLVMDSFDTSLEQLAEAAGKVLCFSDCCLANAPTSDILRGVLKLLGPDEIEEIIDQLVPEPAEPCIRLPLTTPRNKVRARELLAGYLRSRPKHETELLLDILRVRLGLKGAIYVPFGQMMTWDMVRDMAQDGMSFGAHTCAHPILTRVPRDVAKKEIVCSKRRLETVLKKPIELFCYPNGMDSDFDDEIVTRLKRDGFAAACSMIPGTNKRPSDLFALRRVGPHQNLRVFAMKVSGILK